MPKNGNCKRCKHPLAVWESVNCQECQWAIHRDKIAAVRKELESRRDPIDDLSKEEAIGKLKKMRDIIWPYSEMACGERDLHRISAFQVYEEIKDLFEEPLRMLSQLDMGKEEPEVKNDGPIDAHPGCT